MLASSFCKAATTSAPQRVGATWHILKAFEGVEIYYCSRNFAPYMNFLNSELPKGRIDDHSLLITYYGDMFRQSGRNHNNGYKFNKMVTHPI
jgi:hypothetical protein